MPATLKFFGKRRTLGFAVALLTLVCGLPLLRGQQSPSAPQSQPPTASIVRSARLVHLSVIVTDKKGDPVTDLTAGNFTILDDGRPQKVQLFHTETNQAPSITPQPPPADTYTNQISQRATVASNNTILLLDGLNTLVSDQASARQQTIKFLQLIRPSDRLAIYTLGRDLRVLQDFTSDSSALTAALHKYSGQPDSDVVASTPNDLQTGDPTTDAILQDAFQREANMYIQERVERTVAALVAIANHVAALPGRKNLLWVSGSFPFSVMFENLQDINNVIASPGEANLSNQQLFFAEDVDRAVRALNDADVAVYPVDARGLLGKNLDMSKLPSKGPGYGSMNALQQNAANSGSSRRGGGRGVQNATRSSNGARNRASQAAASVLTNPDNTTFETMSALADGTGGEAFYNTNDIAGSLRNAIDDGRFTYEIGYSPVGVQWDGKFHKVSVKIDRRDTIVRARKGYFALPDSALNPQALQFLVNDAVAAPLEATGIALAVHIKPATTASSAPATNSSVAALTAMVFFDPRAIQFNSKDNRYSASVGALFVQLDAQNRVVNSAERTFPLSFSADQYAQFMRQQVEFPQDLTLVPGAVQLRVVLWDGATGKVGAVAVPLAKYLPVPAPPPAKSHEH